MLGWQKRRGDRGRRLWGLFGFALLLFLAAPRPLLAQDGGDSLAGQMLVAAPHMSDPNFSHTVVYLLQHDAGGAFGLVINRPAGEVPLDRLLHLLKGGNGSQGEAGNSGEDVPLLVFSGGPVEPYRAFTLHSRDVMFEESEAIDEDIAVNATDHVLVALADGAGPKRVVFAMGYSGWAPGQLESELAREDWYVIAGDPSLVFSDEPARIWERAVALFGTEL